MSEILSNIVVEQNNINFSPDNNNINVTPEAIQLNIFTAGGGGIGNSSVGELLYNNNFVVDGVPTTSYANGKLTLGNVGDIRITGGTNGYVLQTDGTGNLTWTAQTGNGGGNGVPGGANTQIQYNDSGSFGGNAGFTFDETNGNVNIPGNLNVVGTIYGNANYAITAGTVITNSQPNITSVGTLTGLTINGITSLGNVANVQISGGSNNQVLTTNGSNGLSWTTKSDGSWANAASIPVGGICFGRVYGPTVTPTQPGNTFASNADIQWSSFLSVSPSVTGNVSDITNIGNLTWCASYNSNVVAYTSNGVVWTNKTTPLKPKVAPIKGANNIVVFATNSNRAAYSGDLGNTWSNATLPNSGSWQDIAYGSNTFVICTSQASYNRVAYSTDDGVTWANANVTGSSLNPNYNNIVYGNGIFMMTSLSSPYPAYSSPGGAVWTGITSPGIVNDLAYGNGTWVAVKGNSVSTATVKFSTDNGNSWNNGTIANLGWTTIVYADPYFITSAELSTSIAYSTDGNTWSYANTTSNGGYIGYNPNGRLLVTSASAPGGGSSTISISMPTALYVDSSEGNGANLQPVNNGSYKNLGGASGNVGAMWQRIT